MTAQGTATEPPAPVTPPGPRVAVIVPVYNEAAVLEEFHRRLRCVIDTLPHRVSVYYVNDGSTDGTSQVLGALAAADGRISILTLSRNFGHQAAVTAGLNAASGDIIITMDGDGQHPPDLIPRMLDLIGVGYDIVTTQRLDEARLSWWKRSTSSAFYLLINRLSSTRIVPGSADFRAITGQVLLTLRQLPEYHRFLRGMVAWIGFRVVILPYASAARLGGGSKYSTSKMLKLAMDAIFSFSLMPLQLGVFLGLVFLGLAAAEAVYVLSFWVRGEQRFLIPGWSSLMFAVLITGGILMIALGIIGVYVGYIFQEVKRRPVYIVRSFTGTADDPTQCDANISLVGKVP